MKTDLTQEEIEALREELRPYAAKLTINVDNLSAEELVELKGVTHNPVLQVMSNDNTKQDTYENFISDSFDVIHDKEKYAVHQSKEQSYRMVVFCYTNGLALAQAKQVLASQYAKGLNEDAVEEYLDFFYLADGNVAFKEGKVPTYYEFLEFYSKGKVPADGEVTVDRYDRLYEEEAIIWVNSMLKLKENNNREAMLDLISFAFKDESNKRIGEFARKYLDRIMPSREQINDENYQKDALEWLDIFKDDENPRETALACADRLEKRGQKQTADYLRKFTISKYPLATPVPTTPLDGKDDGNMNM